MLTTNTLRSTALVMASDYEARGYLPFAQRLREAVAATTTDADLHAAIAEMLTFYRLMACPAPARALEMVTG